MIAGILATISGCSSIKSAPAVEGDSPTDSNADDRRYPSDGAKTSGEDGPTSDASATDPVSCEDVTLPCLDPADPRVHDVPTEMDWASAQKTAKSGDTIQIRGLKVGAGHRVPPMVTLRGCQGAKILEGAIGFEGGGGAIEGFEVQGAIVGNQTGSFVVRRNRFVGSYAESGVSARSVDGLVAASVRMTVENNWFEGRPRGVDAATSYDTGTRTVDITIVNNVFARVPQPIQISEGGLVGRITATVVHNTMVDFDTGVGLYGMKTPTVIEATLFAFGRRAIAGSAPADIRNDVAWGLSPDAGAEGAFVVGDPGFVDRAALDLRLKRGSVARDLAKSGAVTRDYRGCPRPAGGGADVGAFEAQDD